MTTEQEFQQAIQNVIAAKASIKCGCKVNEEKANWLYYQCKSYIKAYEERFK